MDLIILSALAGIFFTLIWNTRDLRARLEQITLSNSAVLNTAEVETLIENELARARRLDYSVSILEIRPDEQESASETAKYFLKSVSNGTQPIVERSHSIHLFPGQRKPFVQLRSTDVAVYDKQLQRFVVLLIGTQKVDAERIAERVSRRISTAIEQPVQFGCAEFPADNYLLEDLLNSAKVSMHSAGPAEIAAVPHASPVSQSNG